MGREGESANGFIRVSKRLWKRKWLPILRPADHAMRVSLSFRFLDAVNFETRSPYSFNVVNGFRKQRMAQLLVEQFAKEQRAKAWGKSLSLGREAGSKQS